MIDGVVEHVGIVDVGGEYDDDVEDGDGDGAVLIPSSAARHSAPSAWLSASAGVTPQRISATAKATPAAAACARSRGTASRSTASRSCAVSVNVEL
jgi:hypothetical protein